MMGAIYCAPTPILPNLVMGVLYHGLCVLARQYVVWPALIKSRQSERVVAGLASHNTLTLATFD